MKKYLFIFCIISFTIKSQELSLVSATRQTINYGASPGSVTNYKVTLQKCKKKDIVSIDSVCGIQSGNQVKNNIVKVADPDAASPDYKQVTSYLIKDKGKYMIRFSITKSRGGGRPGAPQNLMVDTTNIEGGIIIYYTSKKKKKTLRVIDFEMLDTVDAP